MRFFTLACLLASSVLAQVDFVHSPCTTPPGGESSMQPSISFDLTSKGIHQMGQAVLKFMQNDIAQPGKILVPLISGEYVMPIGGNIEYNISNVQLTQISIDSSSNQLDVTNQVTNLLMNGLNATIALDYSFYQNNWLKFPNGKGSVNVAATGGNIQIGIGNLPGGKLYVASSVISFANYNIKLTTGFDFLLNLLLWAFKNQVNGLINKQLETQVTQALTTGFSSIDAVVPHAITLLKDPYTTTVDIAYATPQVAASSVRQYLELEFAPKGTNGSAVNSCACPITRDAIPSIDDINGEGYDVVVALPESSVNTLFWTLQQNNMMSFTIPADEEIVISTLFPDHPCDLHVDTDRPPVIYFNQTNPAAAVAEIYLKYTAVETKNGNIFTTFTGENVAQFNITLIPSVFDATKGYTGAAVAVAMETVNVNIGNIKFFGITVPDWTVSILTTKLETMTARAVEEVVNLALADGVALPFPGFVGVQSGVVEFKDAGAHVMMSIEVLQQ